MTARVSLAPIRRPAHPIDAPGAPPQPLAAPRGARVILGAAGTQCAAPIAAAADTLFGPRGACLAGPGGPLFVCDTGHHRLLVWHRTPDADATPANLVIGQPDFNHEGRNAKGTVGAATLNVPTGIAVARNVLAVADAWNHRVLLWHRLPERSNQPADVVLGQDDFTSGLANRGASEPRADTLNWCYGVAIVDGCLFVADTGNRRVLMWSGIPRRNGAPADLVLGQHGFTTRDEGAAEATGAVGMRWPHGVAGTDGALAVADAGSSRVMIWKTRPRRHGAPCDLVLGQANLTHAEHNRGDYVPSAATLHMPYGIALRAGQLVVADTANSRLLGFVTEDLAMGASASALAAQRGFGDRGDNRWAPAARDSLCWPYGVAACDGTLVVSDSGNNRVLLWDTA